MKTVVIGLDAATWRVMKPLIEQGKMPNIRGLMEEGSWGILRSSIPPMTPLAWTSIVTGVNPGKHGIYDFVTQDSKTYRVTPINYFSLNHRPAIWDIFNAYGRKVGFVNFPLVFPPPKVKGFFISGIGSPEQGNYAYPPELDEFLKERNYRIYPRLGPGNRPREYFNEVRELTDIQCRVVVELMKRWNWDLFWVVFQGLDWIQHYLWNVAIDGENAVEAFYCHMDKIVGRLLRVLEDELNVVVLSDHGFREIKAEIHLNNLLEKWGYLKRTRSSKGLAMRIRGNILKLGWALGRKLPVSAKLWIKQYMPEGFHSRVFQNGQLTLHQAIDWTQTKVFSYGYMGKIYIHLKGKFPSGIVEDTEYETLREEVIACLKNLKDPKTGKPIVDKIFTKEEIYFGERLEDAPDIVFNPSNFSYMIYGDFSDSWFHAPRGRVADHDMDGIFIVKGKAIKQSDQLSVTTVDVAPTLLYLHGLPILQDMDGRVLKEVLTDNFIREHKVLIKSIEDESLSETGPYQNKAEQEEIEQRLRDLGYL
ncbi:MAG: hypothetical protein DRN92_06475 [Thermoproteota archaeon]|nr:MAG: hypothetical protein DRN92_06475 [Candidatus Korarchaeota archaeon]